MYKIKFYGIGGQGIVTATRLLAHAVCIYDDKCAKTIPAYGHERRGAPVYSDIVIDHSEITLNSFVYYPDVVIVFDPYLIHKQVEINKGIHDKSILIINCNSVSFIKKHYSDLGFAKILYVDATGIALKNTERPIPNIAMFGAICKAGIVNPSSINATIKEYFSEEDVKQNEKSVTEAYDSTKEW